MGRALLRLKPSRKCANRGYCVRYAVPQLCLNALAGAFAGRALLRLKPSRMCESMGDCVRYAVPHTLPQRPGGRVCWACTAQAKAFAHVC
jgi:hypothetical protein